MKRLLFCLLLFALGGCLCAAPAPLPRRGSGPAPLAPGVYQLRWANSPAGVLFLYPDGTHLHEAGPHTRYCGTWTWDAKTRTLILCERSERIGARLCVMSVVLDWRLAGTTDGDYGQTPFELRRR